MRLRAVIADIRSLQEYPVSPAQSHGKNKVTLEWKVLSFSLSSANLMSSSFPIREKGVPVFLGGFPFFQFLPDSSSSLAEVKAVGTDAPLSEVFRFLETCTVSSLGSGTGVTDFAFLALDFLDFVSVFEDEAELSLSSLESESDEDPDVEVSSEALLLALLIGDRV